MSIIYDVIAKRHRGTNKPNVCVFYDEDKEKALKAMRDYDKKHGFCIETSEGTFSIADLVLREREATGKVISETSYHELFDINGNRRPT